MKRVKGKDKGHIVLYALSTCVWCKMTRKLLDELGVGYNYVYVDLLEENEKEKTMQEFKRWCPQVSFPLLVIRNKKAISGYDKEKIISEIG